MANRTRYRASVSPNGSLTCLARVVGVDAALITQAGIASIEYTINAVGASARSAVTGHDGETLTVADVVYDSLQTDDRWTEDATGYNFAHTIDISGGLPFPSAGTVYEIDYVLTDTAGNPIPVEFEARTPA